MDRAQHWDRTQRAWEAIVLAEGLSAEDPVEAIQSAYERGEGDEFIQPTVIKGHHGIAENEPTLFFNFRSDRARQLSAAFGLSEFTGFERKNVGLRKIYCMTEYDATFPFPVLFKTHIPDNVLAELISNAGLKQFHCSETEKYPHVTYFFNGGREPPYPGEDRKIVPSPQVATYNMNPEMSAAPIANELIAAIESDQYAFAVVNFANADMVGHTADLEATIRADKNPLFKGCCINNLSLVRIQLYTDNRAVKRQPFTAILPGIPSVYTLKYTLCTVNPGSTTSCI